MLKPLNLLFLSTSVGPLGTGLGGGVELTLRNLALALGPRGHRITVVAPTGSSCLGFELVQIAGTLQPSAQSVGREALIELPPNAVLGQMWDYARQVQADYDLILNFAYDWLPLYLTPFFTTPVAHLVSMGSLSEAMDGVLAQVAAQFPQALAVHSQAQADTFPQPMRSALRNLANGFDLSQYQFCPQPQRALAWVGRIAPEKGLEDAVAACQQAQVCLRVFGVMQHPGYWQEIQARYPHAPVEYGGFLPTEKLQQALGQCQGLIMTPKWVEAFGNVAIEALACGVPVIAYRRGGPAEIVEAGVSGYLVEPDDVRGLAEAIARLDQLDRAAARARAESDYSLSAMGDRLEAWFQDLLVSRSVGC